MRHCAQWVKMNKYHHAVFACDFPGTFGMNRAALKGIQVQIILNHKLHHHMHYHTSLGKGGGGEGDSALAMMFAAGIIKNVVVWFQG